MGEKYQNNLYLKNGLSPFFKLWYSFCMFYHKAKKSLGQNFLKSKSALTTIIETADPNTDDVILEIGPGKGALTEKLLMSSGKVIAVEKDDVLFEFLSNKFKHEILNKKLDLIHGDILDFDQSVFDFYKNHDYKIVANIPYNITGQIIRKFLTGTPKPSNMVLLVQKEVSDRIVARDGKESLLSLSVKLYGTPKYIKKVPARDFSPAPKVDSAILHIKDIQSPQLTSKEEEVFFEVLHAGFSHKRKILIGNLSQKYSKEKILTLFSTLGLNEKIRAEDLSLKDWLEFAKKLS
jgi:16S rRNA (adenine1518-N6/adenine1519-N6)-dimethyltransferase